MPTVTWNEIFACMTHIEAELSKSEMKVSLSEVSSRFRSRYESIVVGSLTNLFNVKKSELLMLADAIEDNTRWLADTDRNGSLSRACANKKLIKIMQDLFVVDPVLDLLFVVSEDVLRSDDKDQRFGGYNWDRNPKVIRRRKNGVMNWGTMHTKLAHKVYGSKPVALVPVDDISDTAVFVNGPVLLRYMSRYYSLYEKLEMSDVGFSGGAALLYNLFHFADTVHRYADEHECFTYTKSVRCDVFKLPNHKNSEDRVTRLPRIPVDPDDV
jgi:hypothetical protein